MEILISAMLFTVGVFFTISSVIFAIRYLKIKNTLLKFLFLINACLPISFVGFLTLLYQNDDIENQLIFENGFVLSTELVALLILYAILFVCVVDLIVIFILPLSSTQKIAKDIENKILFSIWSLSLLAFFGLIIFIIVINMSGF